MITRKFVFRGMDLPDPDPAMNPADVKDLYANDYPELINAAIVYNDPVDGVQEYGLVEKTAPAKVTEAPAGSKPSTGKSAAKTQTVEFKPSIGRKG